MQESRFSSGEGGFSLLETVIATGLMAGALAALGQMFAISVANNMSSRNGSYATVLAAQKMEQLRGLTWGFDTLGHAGGRSDDRHGRGARNAGRRHRAEPVAGRDVDEQHAPATSITSIGSAASSAAVRRYRRGLSTLAAGRSLRFRQIPTHSCCRCWSRSISNRPAPRRGAAGQREDAEGAMIVNSRSHAGFTLIEMLIATAITITVMAGVMAVLHPSHGILRTQPEVADMQQRLRVGVDMLKHDLVMAGAGVYLARSGGAWPAISRRSCHFVWGRRPPTTMGQACSNRMR